MRTIKIVYGDILNYTVDAIVNPANRELTHGGGLDHAIRTAAGQQMDRTLNDARKTIGPLTASKVYYSSSYNIKTCKGVIHAAAPNLQGKNGKPDRKDESDLIETYRECLFGAWKLRAKSLAFPILGGGIFQYPPEQSFLLGIQTVLAFIEHEPETPISEVSFIMKSSELFKRCQVILNGQTTIKFDDALKLRLYIMNGYWKDGSKESVIMKIDSDDIELASLFNQRRGDIHYRSVFCIDDFAGVLKPQSKGTNNNCSSDVAHTCIRQSSIRKRVQLSENLQSTPIKKRQLDTNIVIPSVSIAQDDSEESHSEVSRRHRVSMTPEQKRMKHIEAQKKLREKKNAQNIGSQTSPDAKTRTRVSMTPEDIRKRNVESQRKSREKHQTTSHSASRNLTVHLQSILSELPEQHDLGEFNHVCPFCNGLYFKGKRVCCNNGKVWMDEFGRSLPEPIKSLLDDGDRHFLNKIIVYNSLLAMASLVYSKQTVGPFGVQAAKVMGKVSHWPSALYPNIHGREAFGNFYVYNAEDATEARMSSEAVKNFASEVDKEMLKRLTQCIKSHHPLAKSYLMMHHLLQREEEKGRDTGKMIMRIVDRFEAEKMDIQLQQHGGTYSVPIGEDYVSVFFTCSTDQKILPRGLNVYKTLGKHNPVEIKSYIKMVDSLCYPLIFPYGEGLWAARRFPLQDNPILFKDRGNVPANNYPEESLNSDRQQTRTTPELIEPDNTIDDMLVDRHAEEPNIEDINTGEEQVMQPCFKHVLRGDEMIVQQSGLEPIDDFGGYETDESGPDMQNEIDDIYVEEDDQAVLPEEDPNWIGEEEAQMLNSFFAELDRQDAQKFKAAHSRQSRTTTQEGSNVTVDNEDVQDEETGQEREAEVRNHPQPNLIVGEEEVSDDEETGESRRRVRRGFVSMREAALFLNRYPADGPNRIAQFRKLGQLYLIDVCTRIIHQRMEHLQKHYTQTLQSTKKQLIYCLQKNLERNSIDARVGAVTTVPSHVPGSPRYMRKKFEDAVGMANSYGNPDIFLTFTGSSKWPELQRVIPQGDSWADHPMLVAEVFKKKMEAFLDDVLGVKDKNTGNRLPGIFGEIIWFVYSVEFQQRGMPHIHLIISLKEHITTTARIDEYVWAYIPKLLEEDHPDADKMRILRELTLKHMLHRPCQGDQQAYCNQGKPEHWKQCTKRFPKEFNEQTVFGDKSYPDYHRPDDGGTVRRQMSNGTWVDCDNRYVVPFNPFLLKKYCTHINIEIISSVTVLKYLYKYIYKGFDRTIIEIIENFGMKTSRNKKFEGAMTITGHILHGPKLNQHQILERNRQAKELLSKNGIPLKDPETNANTIVYDETSIIEDMRALTACEAAWDIKAYPKCGSSHSVSTLYVHCPDEEPIQFNPGDEEQVLDNLEHSDIMSRLKAWFEVNGQDNAAGERARTLTFNELPKYFTYRNKRWIMRLRDYSSRMLGRVKAVQPRFMEQFAIRLLSMHSKGPRSFEDLRTVEGVVHDTFVGAAKALRLMNDELEWDYCLHEASTYQSPAVIRRLFISILSFCAPTNGLALWNTHKVMMFARSDWSEEKNSAHSLYHISSGLKHHGLSLADFNLPEIVEADLPNSSHLTYDNDDLQDAGSDMHRDFHHEEGGRMRMMLNNEQASAVDTILEALDDEMGGQRLFFIEGAGGTGKTFVYKCLYHLLSSKTKSNSSNDPKRVLCVAHTGIAATLLPNGSTAHRAFGIPLKVEEDMASHLDLSSTQAQFLRTIDVIIWDEACMTDRRIYKAVDNVLRLIRDNNSFMGGILTVFGGDWRQTLPIVEDVRQEAVHNYTLKKTPMWNSISHLHLTANHRAINDPQFSEYLLQVGSGKNYEDPRKCLIRLPGEILVPSEEAVIEWLYGSDQLQNHSEISKQALLTVDNRSSLELNEMILSKLGGSLRTYQAIDQTDTALGFDSMDPEMYKTQTPAGMPPHVLNLKANAQVILLRNQNVRLGLCNGTRLRVLELNDDTILCEPVAPGPFTPPTVLIHRIKMTPARAPTKESAFIRHQFPLRLCYAMTINRSQGQTLNKVGIVLRTPCFAHGQLYVALSRVREHNHLRIYNGTNVVNSLIKNTVNTYVL